MGLITWCNRFIRWGFYLLFGLVPLLLTPWNYELFEYNKMMAVYAITAGITTAWLVRMVKEREYRIAKTPLDIPIALLVASQLISSLFSMDPHVSWFGYYSRFNGGMWSMTSYVLLYYAFLSNMNVFSSHKGELGMMNREYGKMAKPDKSAFSIHNSVFNLLKVTLITATLVAIYGVLERLGVDKHLWVQDVQNRVFSTLGQPNWLAAYLTALAPIAMAIGVLNPPAGRAGAKWPMLNRNPKEILFSIYHLALVILFFLVLLFTRSRSGLLGFAVADAVFLGFLFRSLRSPKELKILKKTIIILHAVLAVIIFANGTGVDKLDRFSWKGLTTKQVATQSAEPLMGRALESGGTEYGTIRKYVWQGAVNAWNSSWKTWLIGTGTETFAFAFYRFRPVGHNQTSEWDFLYNKAHNEYLNYLATTGIFGLGSYLLFIGTFVSWFIKTQMSKLKGQIKSKAQRINHLDFELDSSFGFRILSFALFAGCISILVTNFFGFSVVILQIFLFLFPAIIFAFSPQFITYDSKFRLTIPSWMVWLPVLGGLYVLIKVGSFWYADTLYAKSYRFIRGGLYGQAIPAFTQAIRLNPQEPMYHDELASGYATLAVAAFEGKNATQTAQLATLAIEENTKALKISPRNVNFYKTRTKVYYTLSALEPTFNAKAVEALEAALPLSPNDPKIYYNLAILVGREGNTEKAVQYLLKAKELKSNYRDVYFALWVFYTDEKKLTEAQAILQEYLDTVDPNDKDFIERIK